LFAYQDRFYQINVEQFALFYDKSFLQDITERIVFQQRVFIGVFVEGGNDFVDVELDVHVGLLGEVINRTVVDLELQRQVQLGVGVDVVALLVSQFDSQFEVGRIVVHMDDIVFVGDLVVVLLVGDDQCDRVRSHSLDYQGLTQDV